MAAIRLLTAGEAIAVAWAPVGRAPGPLAHSFRMIPIETAAPRTTLTAYWLSERARRAPRSISWRTLARSSDLGRADHGPIQKWMTWVRIGIGAKGPHLLK